MKEWKCQIAVHCSYSEGGSKPGGYIGSER